MSSVARQRFICHLFFMSYGMVGIVMLPALSRSIEETFGLSHVQFGQMIGLASTLTALTSLAGGWLYDRLGARVIMCGSLLLSAATAAWVGLSQSWGVFRLSLFAFHIAMGLTTVVSPIVSQLYAGERSRGINLLHAFQGVGRLIGPLLVTLCLWAMGKWYSIFYVSAAQFLFCFFLFLWGLEEHGGASREGKRHRSEGGLAPWPVVWLGLAAFTFTSGGEAIMVVWIPNYLESEAGLPKHEALTGLMFMMIGYTAIRLIRGMRRGRPGPRFIITSALFCVAALTLVLFGRGYWWSMAGCVMLGFSFGAYWPSLAAMMFDYFPADQGLLNGLICLASLIGSYIFIVLAGWIGDHHSLRVGLMMIGPVCVAIFAGLYCRFYVLLERRRRLPRRELPGEGARAEAAESNCA